MIREERLARITEFVQRKRYASVEDLMNVTGASKATVRRDLTHLSEVEKLILTRGGATVDMKHWITDLSYNERASINAADKMKLGEPVRKLMEKSASVFLDAGTTTRAVVPSIKDLTGISLITNDISIAADLVGAKGMSVTVTGGEMRPDFYVLRGYVAEEVVRKFHIDTAFIGFDAVDVNKGCYITNTDEVSLKRCVIGAAKQVVALCDRSKFNNSALCSVCPVTDIDIFVTNKEVDREKTAVLEQAGVTVIYA
ncbi:MAG: DeoR/GlpR family DNA-binding transcription regulator [Planctomycetes bacterium]|nr:DeoR/GlpR family DNA-binding transcription regulator [Planctomycetota bacterium]MCD7895822.1 DeoR/GlpR family DNA-binding transcription regulator [Planctomycetaceae bacterium]